LARQTTLKRLGEKEAFLLFEATHESMTRAILITGAAGHLGLALADQLLKVNKSVRVLLLAE
jgi:FlaA1/EpsC-like NDP-sugar epimerase